MINCLDLLALNLWYLYFVHPYLFSHAQSINHLYLIIYYTHCAKVQKYNLIFGANIVVEHYEKRIEILHGCPFEGWHNRARPSHTVRQNWLGWPCPVRSTLKMKPMQEFDSFSIVFYYIISTKYLKVGELFCHVHISGL